jgi:ATP-dependent Clp protease adaptor protein ClpS
MTTDVQIDHKIKIEVQPPKMWKVVFLNDDHTPMDFVIHLLTTIFRHNEERAHQITLEVHETGSAIVGVYTFEIAETKGMEAQKEAQENGFPLQIRVEEE